MMSLSMGLIESTVISSCTLKYNIFMNLIELKHVYKKIRNNNKLLNKCI